jgi:hypothetical protein
MPAFEDYIAGKPLTEELARLKAGVFDAPEPGPMEVPAWEPDNLERPLNDGEREDLRRLMSEPGWRVLQRLRKKAIKAMEQAAIVLSTNNPLANERGIAVGWANLTAFKDQVKLDTLLIEAEVQRLKQGQKPSQG